MRSFFASLGGRFKMTTTIASLVVASVILSVGAVIVSVNIAMTANTGTLVANSQRSSLNAGATILSGALSVVQVSWADDGALEAIKAYTIPRFPDHESTESIARVIGGSAAVFGLSSSSGNFEQVMTSELTPDGARYVHPPLASDDPAFAQLFAGHPVYTTETIQGVPNYAVYYPIIDVSSEDVKGALFIGVPQATITAMVDNTMSLLLIVGLSAVLVFGLLGFVASRAISRPIPRLSAVMQKIAGNELDVEVPYAERHNEIGEMARAVAVFRDNGVRIAQMTEDEIAASEGRRRDRQQMMCELQTAFGAVVDAANAGDFSQRVDAHFADAELNGLAQSVNTLVETVDRGLTETAGVLGALADTDLTRRVVGDYQGAFAELKHDTNAVAEKLSDIVAELRSTSLSLKTATSEILTGANDLSERTTRQAATIEETSASMEQLAATVMDNAKRAQDASSTALTVTRSAEEGGSVMSEANAAMERITTSSSKVSDIIGMIDDIAFQTNLLALNASVEAARAGEAGKGFAVVAVEVRRLAQSAAQASSEVKGLIEQSASEVGVGSKLVAEAALKLSAMVEAARTNTTMMETIAKQSQEQASAIEEVNSAVRQLDEMTQHNAALVEETNAAIEQTEAQANALDKIVDIFRTDERGTRVATPEARDIRTIDTAINPLRKRAKQAANVYLSQGNAAIDSDWSEF